MKVLLILCSLMALSMKLAAQNSDSLAIRKFYNENAIYWPGGMNHYYQNEKPYPLRQMKEALKFSPEASYEFNAYQNNRNASRVLYIAGAAMLVSSVLVKNRDLRLGLAAG